MEKKNHTCQKMNREVKERVRHRVSTADVSFAFNILFSVMFKSNISKAILLFVFLLKVAKRDIPKKPNLPLKSQFHRGILSRSKKPQKRT